MNATKANQRYLIIMRHGQQSPDGLTKHGKHQIANAAEILNRYGLKPDYIVRSTAPRAKQTADTLCGYFGNISGHNEDTLFKACLMDEFDPQHFLDTLPLNKNNIVLSSHDETIQGLGHYLLDDLDIARLFQMIPDHIETQGHQSFMAEHGNALIFAANTGQNNWKFWGWMHDQDIEFAANYKNLAPSMLGKKIDIAGTYEGWNERSIEFQPLIQDCKL